jgi:hypothetical protein
MDNIQEITDILTKLYNNNILDGITDLNRKYIELDVKYNDLIHENKILQDKLKICNDQYSDLNKVSYVRSLSIELQNKNNIIKQLEAQIEKYKTNKPIEIVKSKEEEFKTYQFNEDEYEEIDEYELFKYKKVYYLKEISNNNVYNILNNKPYTHVGSIINGKVILL